MSPEEIIALHWICDCGGSAENVEENAKHVTDQLRAAGYAIVALPKPMVDEFNGTEWPVEQHWTGDEIRPGAVFIRKTDGKIAATSVSNPHDCTADARSLAAALIAAADAVDSAAEVGVLPEQESGDGGV